MVLTKTTSSMIMSLRAPSPGSMVRSVHVILLSLVSVFCSVTNKLGGDEDAIITLTTMKSTIEERAATNKKTKGHMNASPEVVILDRHDRMLLAWQRQFENFRYICEGDVQAVIEKECPFDLVKETLGPSSNSSDLPFASAKPESVLVKELTRIADTFKDSIVNAKTLACLKYRDITLKFLHSIASSFLYFVPIRIIKKVSRIIQFEIPFKGPPYPYRIAQNRDSYTMLLPLVKQIVWTYISSNGITIKTFRKRIADMRADIGATNCMRDKVIASLIEEDRAVDTTSVDVVMLGDCWVGDRAQKCPFFKEIISKVAKASTEFPAAYFQEIWDIIIGKFLKENT